MTPIKEPKEFDLSKKSEPWTEKELSEFRKVMKELKSKNAKSKRRVLRLKDTKSAAS